ncbi:hypothetical protein [Serinicoccus marinus]|uniref:hypothetical protein n=1 Tax=Serinicoccus marinus TaxID=247333 RepID=UPI002491C73E|nr:hypothetical protein [Serinicoccus marinus]
MSQDTSKVSVVPGEWSGDVAGVALGTGVLVGITSTCIFVWAARQIELSGSVGVVEDTSWVDGSFTQRATVLVVLLALWVASLALTAAGVLGAIETRAVLTKPKDTGSTSEGQGKPGQFETRARVDEALKAAGVLVEKLSMARGAVVLGVAGIGIAITALCVMTIVLGDDGGDTVADSTEQTATPGADDPVGQTPAPDPAPTDGGTATGDAP